MSLAGNIQFGMRQLSEVANQLMSVERVLEYTQVPPEPNLRDKGLLEKKLRIKQKDTFVDVPKDWPSRGFIEFKNVYMRYSDEDPPILKNLNLTIEPTEKVKELKDFSKKPYLFLQNSFHLGWNCGQNRSWQIISDFGFV